MAEAETPYADHTPLMQQYLRMQDEHPGTLLLYRLGDFYETFFENAKTLNRLLGLTLTHRGTYHGEPIPMAGIPATTLDQYLVRLVRQGLAVAIAEQIGDPKAERAGMMERRIARIVTAGTLTDQALLSEKTDSVLLAVALPKLKTAPAAIVALTLTNGRFVASKAERCNLLETISRLQPSEVLVAEGFRSVLQELGFAGCVTTLPDWHFDQKLGFERLTRHFGVSHLDAWGIGEERELLAAANALLGYVESTQCQTLTHLEPLQFEQDAAFVHLDSATRRNLELESTLRGESAPTLFSVLDVCKTSMGSRRLRAWMREPLRETRTLVLRQDAIETVFREFSTSEDRFGPLLTGVADIERIAGRIALGSVRPKEAAALRESLPALEELRTRCSALLPEAFQGFSAAMRLPQALSERLQATLLDEPATTLRDGDVIRSSMDPELAQLRSLRDNVGAFLVELERKERERTGIAQLRVEYNRVAGFFIEVPRGQTDKVPDDYRRRQTMKNSERFITPELKAYENKSLSAKERIASLEQALWDDFVRDLQQYVDALLGAAKVVSELDALVALALVAFQHQWIRPELSDRPGIEIVGARHPVVEHAIEHYVPNDCRLIPGRRLLVITGPNMGGKSTYMRSVALIALLTYMGSFVPASKARIGPLDRILTRIGASDDLVRGRSTFMVEMTEAAAILNAATENSLVLMDEIGRGTSTFEGLSLASSIATELASKTRCWTLFATHYFELTELPNALPEVVNIHVSAEETEKTIVFLHDIKEGPATQSYGIAVAELAGIPKPVIRRAKTLLQKLVDRSIESGPQLDLFVGNPNEAPSEATTERAPETERLLSFVEDLAALDADNLTAKEALDLVYSVRSQAKAMTTPKR